MVYPLCIKVEVLMGFKDQVVVGINQVLETIATIIVPLHSTAATSARDDNSRGSIHCPDRRDSGLTGGKPYANTYAGFVHQVVGPHLALELGGYFCPEVSEGSIGGR